MAASFNGLVEKALYMKLLLHTDKWISASVKSHIESMIDISCFVHALEITASFSANY